MGGALIYEGKLHHLGIVHIDMEREPVTLFVRLLISGGLAVGEGQRHRGCAHHSHDPSAINCFLRWRASGRQGSINAGDWGGRFWRLCIGDVSRSREPAIARISEHPRSWYSSSVQMSWSG